AAGASLTLVYTLNIAISDANGSILSNTATVSAATPDPNSGNNSATFNSTVVNAADLSVTKTGPATVTAGTNLTYTITVKDNGPSNAQAVQMTDALPAGTTFVSESHPSGWTATSPPVGGTGTLTESIATLPAGA